MKFRFVSFAALAACVFSSPALAWEQVEREDGCGFYQGFEGPGNSFLYIRQSKEMFDNDLIYIALSNDQWSLATGDAVGRMRFENDEGGWLENDGVAVTNGFFISAPFEHVGNVFGSYYSGLVVYRDGKEIDNLSLSGAYLAWLEFKSCRGVWIAAKEKAEREQMLEEKYTGDPFAD